MRRTALHALLLISFAASLPPAAHAGSDACLAPATGSAAVAEVLDSRTLRLDDGREIILADVRSVGRDADDLAMISHLLIGQHIILHPRDDAPDRYGRQYADVTFPGSLEAVQDHLLKQGLVVLDTVPSSSCLDARQKSEHEARRGKRGIWSRPAIKSAESAGDILTRVGHFTLVEGTVRSVRQWGEITFVNFRGRRAENFALMIARPARMQLESSGLKVGELAGKRLLTRGWIEKRTGPRMVITGPGQILVIQDGTRTGRD